MLVRKKSGKWNFPGGTIESNESPKDAAARELLEEACLRCHSLHELCTIEAGNTLHHVFITHLHDNDQAAPANEIAACKWVIRGELKRILLKSTAAALLSKDLPALSA